MVEAGACILHVLPADAARGAQVFARALCDRLQERGDEHRLLTIFGAPPGPVRADIALDVGPRWRRPLDPRAVLRVRAELAQLGPDLVVAHGGEALKYAVLARPGAPIVYKKIGLSQQRLTQPARRALYRWLTARADAVVAVSHGVADELASLLRVGRDRIWVVPNGRDPARYAPAPPGDRDGLTVMWVGALEPGKRPSWFLDVVRRLQGRHPTLAGVIVGDGPLRPQLVAAAPPNTTFLGRRMDVPELLRDADLLVSTSANEGMSGVLIEAAMTGVPVVTTAVAGAAATVVDGVTGRIVPVDDFEALAAAVAETLADASARRRMGQAALEHSRKHLTIDASAEGWQAMLDHVLGRKPRLEPS